MTLMNLPSPLMRMIYAAAIMAGFLGTIAALMFHAIPESSKDALNMLLGALIFLVREVGAWYFSEKGKS